jgi:MFS family permease
MEFSPSGSQWVLNAYALVFGGLLLLFGRLGDRMGRRRLFIVGLIVFLPDLSWLVLRRKPGCC